MIELKVRESIMSEPVHCRCGGEAHHVSASCWNPEEEKWIPDFWHRVICKNCGIQTKAFYTKTEAIEVWNRAMGTTEKSSIVERIAKVIEHDASITDTDGYKYQRSEYLCGNCKKKVIGGDEYCSHCGCRLDWDEDIPMEYFESGGI